MSPQSSNLQQMFLEKMHHVLYKAKHFLLSSYRNLSEQETKVILVTRLHFTL